MKKYIEVTEVTDQSSRSIIIFVDHISAIQETIYKNEPGSNIFLKGINEPIKLKESYEQICNYLEIPLNRNRAELPPHYRNIYSKK